VKTINVRFNIAADNVKHFIPCFQAKVAKKWDVQLFVGRLFSGIRKMMNKI